MSAPEAGATAVREPGPISRVLSPIRARLAIASLLSAVGAALTLVPLAGIAHVAQLALGGTPTSFGPGASTAVTAEAGTSQALWFTVAVSVACLFLGLMLNTLAGWVAHLADIAVTHELRVAAARRLTRVPLGWFSSRASGDLKQAMQDDIGTLHELTAHFFTTAGRAVGAVLAAALYLFAMDWRLALVSLLPFPTFFLFFGRAVKRSEAAMAGVGAAMARINRAVVELGDGMPVLKTFGAGGQALRAFREAVEGFARVFADFARPLVGALAHANALIAPATVLGVVLFGGSAFVFLGWMTPAQVLPFVLVAPGLSAPLLMLHYITHDLNAAKAAAQRVDELLRTPVLSHPPPGTGGMPLDATVRFEQVGHAWGEDRVLEDISFTVAPGTLTAIVGSSGAGKSTIARLLMRFFDPTCGRITLGGVDLKALDSEQLYRRVGFVLQEVRLIHATVRENIALGRPDADPAQIEAAARAASIHERILRLPRGYDSVVGEDAQLSGGEQQRISIARAVLLDAPVLVLDEPTAAADAENEHAIQDALSRLAVGRGLLVIAHRLDTIAHADQILVVEGGRIVERGRHDELIAQEGRYARLWRLNAAPTAAAMEFPC